MLAEVDHPGVVGLLSVGEGGEWYAMDLVEGVALDRWARGRPLDARVAALADVADALDALHEACIVHGDIKPANVLCGESGRPVVVDLGLAAELRPDASTGFHGTLGYAAPEQLAGAGPDEPSDLYGLGVLAYEVLTGRHPFAAASAEALAWVPTCTLPPTPRLWTPALSLALTDLVLSLLARDPAHRPSTAAEVATALRSTPPVGAQAAPRYPRQRRVLRALLVEASGQPRVVALVGRDRAGLMDVARDLEAAARREVLPLVTSGPGIDGVSVAHHLAGAAGLMVILDGPLPEGVGEGARSTLRFDHPAAASPEIERVLALLRGGPERLGVLAKKLGVGEYDVLEIIEELVEDGVLEEVDEGRAVALTRRED